MSFSLVEQNFIIALIFGSTFLLISMYNLLLFVSTQEVIYRDYFIFLIAITSYTSVYIITPIFPQFAGSFSITTAGLTVFGSLLFVNSFLGLKRPQHPYLAIVFNRMMIFSLFAVFTHGISWILGLGYNDGLSLFLAFIALASLLLEVFTGLWLMNKEANAKLFMITSSPLFFGVLVYIGAWFYLQEYELQEQQLTWFRAFFYSSLMLQMILFSTVIGKRLRNYKNKQLDIQKEISERLKIEVESKTKEINEHRKELERINKTKNKIFALVSHDVRNPLSSMIGIVTIIEKGAMSKDVLVEHLEDIKSRINHSVYSLSRILQWSSSQLEGMSIKQEPVNLKDLIVRNENLFIHQIDNKQIEIIKKIDKRHYILFDPEMINAVVRNLLSNAIKFSHKHGKIWIESFIAQGRVHLVLRDEGVGMSPDLIDKIMNQAELTSERGTAGELGTGFGFLITQDFLNMNDASFSLDSVENEGTTFKLSFLPVNNQ